MIKVNGKTLDLAGAVEVAGLVRQVTGREDTRGVAVALNGEVVGRGEWATRVVREGDVVEILTATAGG